MTDKMLPIQDDAAAPDVLLQRMAERMAELQGQGLLRQRTVYRAPVNFAANDYLALASSPALADAAMQALQRGVGCGSGASALVSGYQSEHLALEQALCQHTGHEAALLFCSGFSANQALLKTLFQPGDTVLSDKLIHASVIDGAKDAGVTLRRFLHNDADSAARLAAKHRPMALITESVFSMDGDCAPLMALRQIADQQGAWLIVDDAHGFGTPVAFPDIGSQPCDACYADIQLITFGKAMGCQGAALLGSQALIDFMVANCRHYIYSTALSPLAAATALAALTLMQDHRLCQQLAENITYFRQRCAHVGIALTASVTAIQPVIIGDSHRTLAIAQQLRGAGFAVGAIRPPTVPRGSARLRITLNAGHSQAQIDAFITALQQALAAHR